MGKSKEKFGRRQFLASGAKLAVATSSLLACEKTAQAKSSAKKTTSSNPPKFIIDSHIHCGSTQSWVAEMVEIYQPRNAMACVLTWIEDMELMRDAIKTYPDVFIGYGRVKLDDPKAIANVETFKENGFVGMKFHNPKKNYDDPSYFPVYKKCEDYSLPMLFHTGISGRRGLDTPDESFTARMRPIYLDTIARQFPKTMVQGAHLGNPWYDEAAEAARWNPNLYFDITGSTLIKWIKLDKLKKLSELLWWADYPAEKNPHTLKGGPAAWEHIVFGTDERPTGLVSNIERFQKLLDANSVPGDMREKMWGLTMAKILGIDPKTHKFIK